MNIPAYLSLISCLPALEEVNLRLPKQVQIEFDCLLEALACLPRLSALALSMGRQSHGDVISDDEAPWPTAFAKLRSLTKLALSCGKSQYYTVAGVVDALVTLTGLAELELSLPGSSVVPAALGQLKGLRSLVLSFLRHCVLEAGCLALPRLASLEFAYCYFPDAVVLPGATALQSLTSIKFKMCRGLRFFDHQLVQLRRLQRIVFYPCGVPGGTAGPWLSRLSADMGALRSSLLHLCCSGSQLTQFPLALTQLVALEHLDASKNEFAVVHAGITALSRLTELVLGKSLCHKQETAGGPLDVRALGDLSAFPALCKLYVQDCKVALSASVLGVTRHASLTKFDLQTATFALESALLVRELSEALERLGRGSVLEVGSRWGA